MKGKFLMYYDWYWKEETPCQAGIALPHDRVVTAEGKTFEEARENLIEAVKAIPEDETIEIC